MDIIRTDRRKQRTPYYIGGGIVGIALITAALSRLEPAAPSVESASVYSDTRPARERY